jgi:predicted GNAT superfamily acetyltransferase
MSQVEVRSCESHQDRAQCVDLQRRIWNFEDEDLVPSAMFVVAQHTGGHAYLAFDGEAAVGLALAFRGEHSGHCYLHSHIVGVVPEYQDRGVGRLLKLHQRSEALREGIDRIEWTFDPLELRNAYFNIARLGAVIRRFIPDCYGASTSPLHGSFPTDRFVAEWHLRSTRVERALTGANEPRRGHDAVEIGVPANIRELKANHAARALEIQSELRMKFTDLFARGFAVTGFRREREQGVYILEPHEN